MGVVSVHENALGDGVVSIKVERIVLIGKELNVYAKFVGNLLQYCRHNQKTEEANFAQSNVMGNGNLNIGEERKLLPG